MPAWHEGGMDIVDKARRSAMMARIRGKDTAPELKVRRAVHAMGYRFRLHRRGLPGSPDLVFPGSKKVIFVHGCYWHRHEGCRYATVPKSNPEFWVEKFEKNVTRDRRVLEKLTNLAWDAMVVWECETRDATVLKERIASHLGQRGIDELQG
jgi:DNA mismatch endonuclease (patch repair protein)